MLGKGRVESPEMLSSFTHLKIASDTNVVLRIQLPMLFQEFMQVCSAQGWTLRGQRSLHVRAGEVRVKECES